MLSFIYEGLDTKGVDTMKKILLVGLAMTVALVGFMTSCGSTSIPGIYVNQDNPNEYIELNEDGTFYVEEQGFGLDGEWEASDGNLTLSFYMGLTAGAEIKGNKICDTDGKVWVKQETETAAVDDGSSVVAMPEIETPSPIQTPAASQNCNP